MSIYSQKRKDSILNILMEIKHSSIIFSLSTRKDIHNPRNAIAEKHGNVAEIASVLVAIALISMNEG